MPRCLPLFFPISALLLAPACCSRQDPSQQQWQGPDDPSHETRQECQSQGKTFRALECEELSEDECLRRTNPQQQQYQDMYRCLDAGARMDQGVCRTPDGGPRTGGPCEVVKRQ
jgi:hypothetical protein